MAKVIPGYDFGVNEVPVQSTLLLQAQQMQITDVKFSDVGPGIFTGSGLFKAGDSSNATDSIRFGEGIGTMWVSPLGDLWVYEASGPVRLVRINGGWETKRMRVFQSDGTVPGVPLQDFNSPVGLGGEDLWRTDTDSSISTNSIIVASKIDTVISQHDARQGAVSGILCSTATSDYGIVCGRGITRFFDFSKTSSATWNALLDMQTAYRVAFSDGTTVVTSFSKKYWHSAPTANKWQGWTAVPGPNSSKVSDVGGNHVWRVEFVGWNFGVQLYSNEQNGV